MNSSLPRRALVATALAAAALLPASPALAQSLTVTDGTSDAWEEHYDDTTGEPTHTAAGSPVNSDVTKYVVKHGERKVVVRTFFADLRKSEEGVVVGAKIRTNEGLKRIGFVFQDQGMGADTLLINSRGQVRCRGLAHAIDWTGDRIDLTVPRACLSQPRWVEVTVAAGNNASEGGPSYIDVAGTAGHRWSSWSDRVRRG